MGGDYRKFTVEMQLMNDEYRLWRSGIDGSTCIVESYKDKRSLYFAVSNLLPSASLLSQGNREYRLILMGVNEGEIIHRDFGSFFVDQKGDGSFFKKFTGPALECYTHCLLVSADRADGSIETIMSGEMPFFHKPEEEMSEEPAGPCQFDVTWKSIFDNVSDKNAVAAFSESMDETGAKWYRISSGSQIPAPLTNCRDQVEKYGHYIVGQRESSYYIGIPGRFLQGEQPLREQKCFVLWQPIRGGEKFFKELSELTEKLQEEIFGYWIGGIDTVSGEIIPL